MNIPAHHLAGNRSNISELDQYDTPESATRSLMSRITFNGLIWECACGNMSMAKVLEQYNAVLATDILTGTDFLKTNFICENVVTNPPYRLAEKFVNHALDSAIEKVAMFLRLNFLEGQSRYKMFTKTPLKQILVFSKRQALHPPGVIVTTGGTIAYAWFIWEHGYADKPYVDWIND